MNLTRELVDVAEACGRAVERAPVVGGVLQGTCRPEDYFAFMVQTYHYVKATAPNLVLAAQSLEREGRYSALAALYREKAVEETGHDDWAIIDALSVGLARGTLAAPSPAVLAYLAWNRATIEAGDPVGYFGTAFVLEHLGATCAPRAVQNLVASGAVPESALRFLAGHGEADQGHLAELLSALAQVAEPDAQAAILLSAQVTAALYPRFFVGAAKVS